MDSIFCCRGKMVEFWTVDRRVANFTSSVEKRTWCYNGRRLTADVRVVNEAVDGTWEGREEKEEVTKGVTPLPFFRYLPQIWALAGGPIEETEGDCSCLPPSDERGGRSYRAEVGRIPKGFVPDEILFVFGLAPRRLEKGELLVKERGVHSSDWSHQWDVDVLREGSVVTENDIRDGHLLQPGDSAVLRESVQTNLRGYYTAKVLFKNVDGRLVREDGEVDEKRAFARQQAIDLEEEFGLSDREAWMVIHEAGPGAAFHAAAYGRSLLEAGKDPDTLIVALNQGGPDVGQPGRERTRATLHRLGIAPPERTRGSRDFFRVLLGAREYVRIKKARLKD